jgi:acetyl esterase/lipase
MQKVTRRRALQSMLAAAGGGTALLPAAGAVLAPAARATPPVAAGAPSVADPLEVIDIWPGPPPGDVPAGLAEEIVERPNDLGLRDRIIRHVIRPRVTVFRPTGRPRGALLLLPGGGYRHVVVDKEGFETARWLAARGLVVFVLFYRLPASGWAGGPDAPLQDAQRAMRVIRQRAATWDLDPAQLGVIGFSAGGHVAARLAYGSAAAAYAAIDDADRTSVRPDVAALIYPVVAMDDPVAHAGSREQLLGPSPDPALMHAYSADTIVRPDAPPTFILHAADDTSVPIENALRMAQALRSAVVPVDVHVFAAGGHGFGLRYVADKPVAAWPDLLLRWIDWRRQTKSLP